MFVCIVQWFGVWLNRGCVPSFVRQIRYYTGNDVRFVITY